MHIGYDGVCPFEEPPALIEKYEGDKSELDRAVDYITVIKDLDAEKALFNCGKQKIDGSGGLTIDELEHQARQLGQIESNGIDFWETVDKRALETSDEEYHRPK